MAKLNSVNVFWWKPIAKINCEVFFSWNEPIAKKKSIKKIPPTILKKTFQLQLHDFINIIFLSFLVLFISLVALNYFGGVTMPPKSLINCFNYKSLEKILCILLKNHEQNYKENENIVPPKNRKSDETLNKKLRKILKHHPRN